MAGVKGKSGRKKAINPHCGYLAARVQKELFEEFKKVADEDTVSESIRQAMKLYIKSRGGN